MLHKWIFDRIVSLAGLLLLCWVFPIVAILIKIKMPGGPAFFVQMRVGKDGKLFKCHKFRTMRVNNGGSSVTVAGESRITPLGATLRRYKIDELPQLWDVLIGKMSFVGPRPDVPGYADVLTGDDRVVLKLRPGITGPATLKYRSEDEMIASFISSVRSKPDVASHYNADFQKMTDQEVALWYNDFIIYPDKVSINKFYYKNYSFIKDLEMIVATVVGGHITYKGEII